MHDQEFVRAVVRVISSVDALGTSRTDPGHRRRQNSILHLPPDFHLPSRISVSAPSVRPDDDVAPMHTLHALLRSLQSTSLSACTLSLWHTTQFNLVDSCIFVHHGRQADASGGSVVFHGPLWALLFNLLFLSRGNG